MRTTCFWKLLDELPGGATDAREWIARLDQEWPAVGPLLRTTGAIATSVACPSPGGSGCPRRVIHHVDGSIRAVCGDTPKMCDDQDLAREDIAILEIDRTKLAKAIAAALSLSERPLAVGRETVIEIGRHDVYAGRGFPVFLVIPGPWFGQSIEPFAGLAAISGPKVLLTPTRRSLGTSVTRHLEAIGVTRLALSDILVADRQDSLAVAQPVATLFAALRQAVADGAASGGPALVWSLPPDARWEEITIAFISEQVINVSFRGETRRFEPDQLRMKDIRSGKPKRQWWYLTALAHAGGTLPVDPPPGVKGHQKQKQELSGLLRECFGIPTEPIPADGREYRARFVIRADDLNQGKADQRQRKFADRL